jgi:hypothetical protein
MLLRLLFYLLYLLFLLYFLLFFRLNIVGFGLILKLYWFWLFLYLILALFLHVVMIFLLTLFLYASLILFINKLHTNWYMPISILFKIFLNKLILILYNLLINLNLRWFPFHKFIPLKSFLNHFDCVFVSYF